MDTPDPITIGATLVSLSAIAGIYLKINSALRQMAGRGDGREITNNPLNTQSVFRPATMEDVNRVDSKLTQLEHRIEDYMKESSTSRDSISDDVSDLRDRMDDKLTTVNESLSEISRALGRLEGS